MKFYYYCFYQISNSYKVFGEKNPEISGTAIISACQSAHLLTILSFFDILNETIIYSICIGIIVINYFFILTEKKYLELSKRWENENPKYKKIKLYLVWFYVIASILMYLLALYINH